MTQIDALQSPELLLKPELTLIDEVPQTGMGVVVQQGKFTDVGPFNEMLSRHPNLRVVDLPSRLLMPGFIDTHNHITQSYGKALAFGEPSEIFKRIWVPLEQHLTDEDLQISAQPSAMPAHVQVLVLKPLKRQ